MTAIGQADLIAYDQVRQIEDCDRDMALAGAKIT